MIIVIISKDSINTAWWRMLGGRI